MSRAQKRATTTVVVGVQISEVGTDVDEEKNTNASNFTTVRAREFQ